ncbi:MAG: hypothetical protein K2J58_05650 [Muribaculaceae bacterium]|nr:hypothetical protein [Muribaculaceae bacterium]
MKEQDNKLKLRETEQLCRLYLDCRLSVFEENELQYVLTKIDHHSPLIDEVRGMMGIKTKESHTSSYGSISDGKHRFPRLALYLGIAASIAILFSVGIPFLHDSSPLQDTGHDDYIAYAYGHRLNDEAARSQVEADIKTADDFMKEMTELEARDRQMIENITNLENFEQ